MNLYAEIENATFNQQVFAIGHDYTGAQTERSYRIVLPSIGVRAEF